MSKDGTNRGGLRPNAGTKSTVFKQSNYDGNIDALIGELPDVEDLGDDDIPEASDYLKDKQFAKNPDDVYTLEAEDIYKKTYKWLRRLGCEEIVGQQLIERYAMSMARWIQCERKISKHGLLSAHPTTKAPISSPFVTMSREYKKQVNADFYQIYVIVREHSLGIEDETDEMEDLLD